MRTLQADASPAGVMALPGILRAIPPSQVWKMQQRALSVFRSVFRTLDQHVNGLMHVLIARYREALLGSVAVAAAPAPALPTSSLRPTAYWRPPGYRQRVFPAPQAVSLPDSIAPAGLGAAVGSLAAALAAPPPESVTAYIASQHPLQVARQFSAALASLNSTDRCVRGYD